MKMTEKLTARAWLEAIRENLIGRAELIRGRDGGRVTQTDVVATQNDVGLHALERYKSKPSRIRAERTLLSVDAFCEYVSDFQDVKQTAIYLDADRGRFHAVIDDHVADGPEWGTHEALYTPEQSWEWRAWKELAGGTGRVLAQKEFAEAIEAQLHTFADPEPNAMLQAALKFEALEAMTLGSTLNLDNGATRFTFERNDRRRSVEFPHRATLRMPIFENEQAEDFDVRVRYKTNEGAVRFWFSFVDTWERRQRDALRMMAGQIRDRLAVRHYEGRPGTRERGIE